MKKLTCGALALALLAGTASAALAQEERGDRMERGDYPSRGAGRGGSPESRGMPRPAEAPRMAPQAAEAPRAVEAPRGPGPRGDGGQQGWQGGGGRGDGDRGDRGGPRGDQSGPRNGGGNPGGPRGEQGGPRNGGGNPGWNGPPRGGRGDDGYRGDRGDRGDRGGPRNGNYGGYGGGRGGWDRDWNNNDSRWGDNHGGPRSQPRPKFDPRQYGRNYRSQQRYGGWHYSAPSGFYFRSWSFGDFLPRSWWGPQYRILDWYQYGLPIPPIGYDWVRVGDDAILVDMFTGRVVQVIYQVFW